MTNKRKLLTAQAELEKAGVEIAALKARVNNAFRNAGAPVRDYTALFADIDRQQFISRYKWEGLPDYLPDNLIERLFYYRGCFCAFFHGGTLYCLPFANAGDLTVYGTPSKVRPVTFNGRDISFNGLELITYIDGGENRDAKAVIFYDKSPALSASLPVPQASINRPLIELSCEILQKADINLVNSTKKGLISVNSNNQRDVILKEINESAADYSPYIVTTGDTLTGDGVEVFNANIELMTDQYIQYLASINNIRCYAMGVKNSGMFEKSDRVVIGELSGDELQTNLILENGLKLRQRALEQLKKLYPEYSDTLNKISVSINTDAYANNSASEIETTTDKSEVSESVKEVNNV